MNRHARRGRAARAQSSPLASLASLASHWPQVDAGSVGERRGEVVFAVCQHDASCPRLPAPAA